MFFRRGVPWVPVRTREIVTKFSCCALNFLDMDLTVAIDQELRLHVEPHSVSIATTSKLARRLVREVEGLNCVLDYAYFVVQGVCPKRGRPFARNDH